MAAAEESSSSSGTQQQQQQQEELEPVMLLAQDMFHKTAEYLNGEFDSTYSSMSYLAAVTKLPRPNPKSSPSPKPL